MSLLRSEKVRICLTCPLYEQPLVPSEGPADAEVMVVGEAPHWEEVQDGRPFVGDSGRYLNGMLSEIGIDRSGLYIANALKCQIPKRLQGKKTGKEVATAMEHCRKRLILEVRRLKPKVILGLGDIALRSITGLRGITKCRGELVPPHADFTEAGSIHVIPTFHPAFLIRGNEQYRPIVIRDITRAMLVARGVLTESRKPVKYRYVANFGHVYLLFKYLQRESVIAIDLETSGYSRKHERVLVDARNYLKAKVSCISFAFAKYEAWVLPILGFGNVPIWSSTQREYIQTGLKLLLEDPAKTWVLQNAPFDLRFLAQKFQIDISKVNFQDVMVMQGLVDENTPKDLETIALMYTDLGNYKQRISKRAKVAKAEGLPLWHLNRQRNVTGFLSPRKVRL